jgi:hypothetical protein
VQKLEEAAQRHQFVRRCHAYACTLRLHGGGCCRCLSMRTAPSGQSPASATPWRGRAVPGTVGEAEMRPC